VTKKAARTGKELERRIANAYRQMGARKVEHDVELAGHQIDVYVELETADRSLHCIAVEAKDHTSPVGIGLVREFSAVVDRLRRERMIDEGVIVSAAGFSKQARNAARIDNIRLLESADLEAIVAQSEVGEWKAAVFDEEAFDVFLSYSHLDAEFTEELAKRLEDEAKLRVWLDRWVLVPGERWQRPMANGIHRTKSCAVCIGEQTPQGWFREETERALNRQVKDPSFRVIPVLLPNAQPVSVDSFLELRTWVDFRSGLDDRRAFHILVCGIKGVAPGRESYGEEMTLEPTHAQVREKLRQLRQLRREQLIDDSITLEYQRRLLDLWMEG
jgi:hypothetical protein